MSEENYTNEGNYTEDTSTSFTDSSFNTPVDNQPEGSSDFGIVALVLGIIALLTFCTVCLNIPLAILSIIFAIIQLVRGNGKGLAVGGIITSALSIVACIIFYLIIGMSIPKFSDMDNYSDILEEYSQEYDELYNDLYDDDYDYDDYDDLYEDDDDTF